LGKTRAEAEQITTQAEKSNANAQGKAEAVAEAKTVVEKPLARAKKLRQKPISVI